MKKGRTDDGGQIQCKNLLGLHALRHLPHGDPPEVKPYIPPIMLELGLTADA
jgi:hypothetical protein